MRFLTAILLLLHLAPAVHADERQGFSLEEASKHRQAWTSANWDDGGELSRYVFLNMPEFWSHSLILRRGPVRPLPLRPSEAVAGFTTKTRLGEMPLRAYVEQTTVDGVLVLHEGNVVFEAYPRMLPHDKHLHMSISKVFVSTLVAMLEDRDHVDVNESVSHYLPELVGSGWDGVPVLDVLDMASGIDCRQSIPGVYDDPSTCYYQYEAALGWLPATEATATDPHEYVGSLAARRPSGEAFEYSSVNTFVLRWLVERVTGERYAELLSRVLWSTIGAESDALIVAPIRGVPIASSGLSSTLRDVGRFGLLFTASGRSRVNPLVSDRHLQHIQKGGRTEIFAPGPDEEPRTVNGEAALHNSYQWDFVMRDGDFFKGGYGGQGLYISPSRDLVIAFFGTMNVDGSGHEMTDVARQLAVSGLFDQ